MNNKGADQTALMLRLICAFVVRIWFSQDVAHMIAIMLFKLFLIIISIFRMSDFFGFFFFRYYPIFSSTAVAENPCSSFGCEHICTLNSELKPVCMCAVGYEPAEDSKKCLSKYMKRAAV